MNRLETSIHLSKCLDKVFDVDDQSTIAVLFLVDTCGLLSENLIDLLEGGIFLGQLLGELGLSLEDRLHVEPLALDLQKEFDGFGDAGDVGLPKVDLIVKLLVVWRGFVTCQSLGMLFHQCQNVISRVDLKVVLRGIPGLFLCDIHVSLRILLPNPLNLNQTLLNLQLVTRIIAQIIYKHLVLVQLQIEHAFKVKLRRVLIEFLFDFEPDIIPVTWSD